MIADERAIESLIARMLQAVDRLDWSAARETFDDAIEVDYTSLFGGQPERLATDVLIERWQSLLPGFDATQHITGPVVTSITNGMAVADTHLRAYHYINDAPGGSWTLVGHYTLGARRTAQGWRLTRLRVDVYRQEGDTHLPALASARVRDGKLRAVRREGEKS